MLDCIDFGDGVAVQYLEQARASAKTFFQTMDQDLKNVILPKDMQTQAPTAAAVPSSGPDMNTPQSNYVVYHMNNTTTAAEAPPQGTSSNTAGVTGQANGATANGILANGSAVKTPIQAAINEIPIKGKTTQAATDTSPTKNPGEIAIDILEQFATNIIEPLAKTLMDKLGTDLDDLIALLKDGSMEKLWTLVADAADTVISVIAEFVDGFLKFCEDIVNDLQDLLTEPIEIPFFTDLYEFVCELMGHEEQFTLINAVSFVISIPLTTMMKIGGYGTLLDHNDIMGLDRPSFPSDLVSTVQGALRGPSLEAVRSAQGNRKHTKGPRLMDLQATNDETFQPPLALKYVSGSLGAINCIAAIIHNGLDIKFLVTDKSPRWMRNFKLTLSVTRLIASAPLPKAEVDAKAYQVRWVAWFISNGWRIFINAVKPGSPPPNRVVPINPAPPRLVLPPGFEYGGGMAINVVTLVMAAVCDGMDQVNGLTWAGDIVSNTGGAFSSLGKQLVENGGSAAEVGLPMMYIATFVAIGGNVCSFVNAGGTLVNAAEGRNVWQGLL